MTPVPRTNYLLGVPLDGHWRELINTDASEFGGAGWGNFGGVEAAPVRSHGHRQSVCITLPPLSTLILEHCP
jgi:1,4-alpha-glucan branching enzyme